MVRVDSSMDIECLCLPSFWGGIFRVADRFSRISQGVIGVFRFYDLVV